MPATLSSEVENFENNELGEIGEPFSWLLKQAEAALELKDYPNALCVYRKMLKMSRGRKPLHLHVHLKLAEIYRVTEDFTKFKSHAMAAISLDPDNAQIRFELGKSLVEFGKEREAVSVFQSAALRAPNNPLYQAAFARILNKTGKSEEALCVLRQALAREPHNLNLQKELELVFNLVQFQRSQTAEALSPAAQSKSQRLQQDGFSVVVREESSFVEDCDRLQDYREYLAKNPESPLVYRKWLDFDDECLGLIYQGTLRNLTAEENLRYAKLQSVLLQNA